MVLYILPSFERCAMQWIATGIGITLGLLIAQKIQKNRLPKTGRLHWLARAVETIVEIFV